MRIKNFIDVHTNSSKEGFDYNEHNRFFKTIDNLRFVQTRFCCHYPASICPLKKFGVAMSISREDCDAYCMCAIRFLEVLACVIRSGVELEMNRKSVRPMCKIQNVRSKRSKIESNEYVCCHLFCFIFHHFNHSSHHQCVHEYLRNVVLHRI